MVERRARVPRAPGGGRPGVQHRQPALVGDDLRPRAAHQAAHRRDGRDRLPAARTTPTSSCGSRTSRRRASCSAGSRRSSSTTASRRRSRGTGRRRPHPPRLARRRRARSSPRSPRCSRAGCSRWARRWPSSRPSSRAPARSSTRSPSRSGTAALHLAVLALGLEPGDEVLVPAYTFPATANVVALAGLKPVLVDVDPETMNIDPAQIEVGPRTKALLAVHLFGRPLRASRSCPTLPLLEDAAGALGARRRGRACGGARRRRLPQLPPAQDRHDRRGRRGHDRRRRVRRRGPRSCATTAGARSPTPTCPRRGSTTGSRTSSARSGSRSSRRLDELLADAHADRRRLRASGSRDLPVAAARGRRGRRPRLAGLRDPGRRPRRRARRAPRAGDRGADRHLRAALLGAYRDQGVFPGARRVFERALALPFHTRLTEGELDRVAEALDKLVSHH